MTGRHINDQQARIYMRLRTDHTQTTAAAKAGLSVATARALLTPDEVRNLAQDRELLFLAGLRPIIADKLRYYLSRVRRHLRPGLKGRARIGSDS